MFVACGPQYIYYYWCVYVCVCVRARVHTCTWDILTHCGVDEREVVWIKQAWSFSLLSIKGLNNIYILIQFVLISFFLFQEQLEHSLSQKY